MQRLKKKAPLMNSLTSRRVATAGVLLAATLIVSLIESYIPPLIPIAPYAKVGFCNVFLMTALLLLGYKYCILMVIIKCVFVAILSGNVFFLAYSLPASFIAYSISAILFNCPKISVVAISTVSSLILNFIETAISTAVIGHSMWLASPYILLIGGISGFGVGVLTFILLKGLPQSLYIKLDAENENKNEGKAVDYTIKKSIENIPLKNENNENNIEKKEDDNIDNAVENAEIILQDDNDKINDK